MKEIQKSVQGHMSRRGVLKRAAAVLLAAAVLVAAAACGSTSPANGQGGAQGQGAQTAAADPQGGASGSTAAAAGEGGSLAEAASAAAQEIEIPEKPYLRDDGGVSMEVFAMDTYMTLLAYGEESKEDPDGTAQAEEAVLAAAAEIHRLDSMLSTGDADSEISKLNAAGGGEASDVVLDLIARSQTLRAQTGGLFEIAIYPVMKLWGFPTQEFRVPEKSEIDEALQLADASAITIERPAAPAEASAPGAGAAKVETPGEDAAAESGAATGQTAPPDEAAPNAGAKEGEETGSSSGQTAGTAGTAAAADLAAAPRAAKVTFGIPGMEIDLGGIAKGYTSSRVMEIFKEHGIKHGLVSLGGNVQALGAKVNGKPWRVAIQNPESDLEYLGILDIQDRCVITSGGYERYFVENGRRYHHIIDPRTGYPADSGLLSATIISRDGALADGLSTSLFIMGKDEAETFWRAHADAFDYVLEDTDGTLYVTEGAAGLLTTDAKTEVIKK